MTKETSITKSQTTFTQDSDMALHIYLHHDLNSFYRSQATIDLLLSPIVTTVKFMTDFPRGEYLTVDRSCSAILRKSPTVQRLMFFYTESWLRSAAFPLIFGLRDLCAMSFNVSQLLPRDVLILHLAQLPDLQVLGTVHIPTSDISLFTTNSGHFPSLNDFTVFLYDWPSATTLIKSMGCPFKYLKVECGILGNLSAIKEFIAASITRHPFIADSLLSIDLSTRQKKENLPFYTCLTSEDLHSGRYSPAHICNLSSSTSLFSTFWVMIGLPMRWPQPGHCWKHFILNNISWGPCQT
jgi:hypothetical protein